MNSIDSQIYKALVVYAEDLQDRFPNNKEAIEIACDMVNLA